MRFHNLVVYFSSFLSKVISERRKKNHQNQIIRQIFFFVIQPQLDNYGKFTLFSLLIRSQLDNYIFVCRDFHDWMKENLHD